MKLGLMELLLENEGVYELSRIEAFGNYYCNNHNRDDKVIVSYFKTESGEIIKTILEKDNITDFINVYFTNPNNVSTDECIEALIRGLCLQINSMRSNLIRRGNNEQLCVKVNYSESNINDSKFDNALIENIMFESLGYEKFQQSLLRTGSMTTYEQKKLLLEPKYAEKHYFNKKLYESGRDEYLSWDEFFMASAKLCALRSKDPSTQVGACIVNENNIILSLGYNGAPNGWEDRKFPWDRSGDYHDTKYPLVVHAEANAILHCIGQGQDLNNSKIYVDLFPCNQCAQLIAQSGIKEVIYMSDKYAYTDAVKASKRLFDNCGVTYRQLVPDKEITLKLKL